MKQRIIITEEEKTRILGLHQSKTKKIISENLQVQVGMKGTSVLQDNAQGFSQVITSVTPYKECGITEVVFGKVRYGYYKPENVDESKSEISFKRYGEGVKSKNPCTDWAEMDNWGLLKIEGATGTQGATNPQTATGTQPTGSNVQTSMNVPQDQMKAKIEFLQGKLNDKYKSGLKVDGKWGPKTAAAVQKALGSLPPASGAKTETQISSSGSTDINQVGSTSGL